MFSFISMKQSKPSWFFWLYVTLVVLVYAGGGIATLVVDVTIGGDAGSLATNSFVIAVLVMIVSWVPVSFIEGAIQKHRLQLMT